MMKRKANANRKKTAAARVTNEGIAAPGIAAIGRETLATARALVGACGTDVARHARHEWIHLVAIVRRIVETQVDIAALGRDGLVRCGSLIKQRAVALTGASPLQRA